MNKKEGAVQPTQTVVDELLKSAQQEFPGVIELVKAYGDYEETISLIQQYLEIDKAQPQITTSNHSCPVTIG